MRFCVPQLLVARISLLKRQFFLLHLSEFYPMGNRASRAANIDMSAVKTYVDNIIANKKVAVFSKSYCPYCHKAKDAINSFTLKADALEWVEIDKRDDTDAIQDYLKDLTGGRSVPRVFIDGKFIGGGDDTVAAKKSGQLEEKLKAAGAI